MFGLIIAIICVVLIVGCIFGASYDAKERRDARRRNRP